MQSYADYLFIIVLPDLLAREIERYKRASANKIGDFEGMYSTPNIMVTHQTRCKPFLVQPAITRMERKLLTVTPVQLLVNGFCFIDNERYEKTIYAVVETNDVTMRWFKLVHQQIGVKPKNFLPQIPIVKNIPATAFNKLWPNFQNREFKAAIKVNGITVLHRDTFVDHCEWRLYRELFLGNRLAPF